MILFRKTENKGDIMKGNIKKFVIIVAIVAALFFTYPVNMSRADREYVKEQIEDIKEKQNSDRIAFAHISYTGKARTDKGFVIYAFYAVNSFSIDDKGEIFTFEGSGSEHCIYTDNNYNILKIEYPLGVTSADYYKSRIKMFPLPVRIRMIGQSGTSYKDEDFKKAEKILKGRQSR